MIDRGKRSKTLSKVKPVENITKNPQSFLETKQFFCQNYLNDALIEIICKFL